MRPISILFALFLVVPLAEIYVLIQVGGAIGALWTISLVVATAALGAVLVRAQGFATLGRMRSQRAAGEVPAMAVLEGVLLFLAGALLMTPGFFTDAIGFGFLVPPLRRRLIRHVVGRCAGLGGSGTGSADASGAHGATPPIEGDFERLD
ncbi:MAG: FxsA family protein [Gammaproteobacteria bacterium]|nr:FxsA family protein [Gammaproteobacteria bacterium]